jgi:ATP-binding cassette subfamily B protein
MAGLLLSFNWLIATALFLTAIPGLLVRMKYAAEVFDWTCNVTKTMRRGWYFNEVLTRNTHAKEIRVYGLGSLFAKMYSSLCEQLRNARVKIAIRHSTSEFAAELGATLALFGSYAFVVYRAVQGLISLGDVVMFFQAFQRGLAALQQAFVELSNLYEDNLFLSSLD